MALCLQVEYGKENDAAANVTVTFTHLFPTPTLVAAEQEALQNIYSRSDKTPPWFASLKVTARQNIEESFATGIAQRAWYLADQRSTLVGSKTSRF